MSDHSNQEKDENGDLLAVEELLLSAIEGTQS
jgi:hypothetical protein